MSYVRQPAVAGQFYPGGADSCRLLADQLLASQAPQPAVGAMVPHAGWVYSGALAAAGLAAIAQSKPQTVVIFGAVHTQDHNAASIAPNGAWRTPLGMLAIDEELAGSLLQCRHIVAAPEAHTYEHSIEVELPLLQRLLPQAAIVPVSIRPGPVAAEIGSYCAEQARVTGRKIAFVGSTDLTHYGPAFGFEPQGPGWPGIRWAKEVNDRRFIHLASTEMANQLVPEAAANRNACGSGAIAALVAAMRVLGAAECQELGHTCSAEVQTNDTPDPMNSVGYCAMAFRRPIA